MAFVDDIISDEVAPPWLQNGYAKLYMQTLGMGLDAIAARAQQAAVVSLPGQGDPSALPYIGLDRVMVQGSSEPDAAFIVRLSAAFDAWRVGGSDWGALWQVLSLFVGFSGGTPPGRIVSDLIPSWSYYGVGANFAVPPLSIESRTDNWNWDNNVEVTGLAPGQVPWYRIWLIIDSFAPTAWSAPAHVLGAGSPALGDQSMCIGFDIPPGIFASMRAILRPWHAAHAWVRWIVINFNSGSYDPNGANAEPDGTWGPWAKMVAGFSVAGVNQWVPTRDATARYVDGVVTGS